MQRGRETEAEGESQCGREVTSGNSVLRYVAKQQSRDTKQPQRLNLTTDNHKDAKQQQRHSKQTQRCQNKTG